ncbi:hypothetical protein Clacol_004196 [Clathrus columnatus]|uniref:BTB domain-containing protein n=1 Tax=Clathrus columnatus TaxID=1419009 RepID=A0AAV5AAD0_9AGAM|nr:hypothetical protein Clacol_004196 [Clathrus columnatus]
MAQDRDTCERHPELYMSDGTVILVAGSTLFRIHPDTSHLTKFPLAPTTANLYDGCPVSILDDNSEDLGYFLKATMGLCHFESDQPMSYPMASAILRLSSKYGVQCLRRKAMRHFQRIIPQTYNDIGQKESFDEVFGPDKLEWPHPFQLISLFRECRLRLFLPWTYYIACSLLGFENLVVQYDNGNPNAKDTGIALLGWRSLCAITRNIRNAVIMFSAQDCRADSYCNDAMRLAWMRKAADSVGCQAMAQWGLFTFLAGGTGGLKDEKDFIFNNGRPCLLCTKMWLKQEEDARAAIWSQLPRIFEFPDWKTLQLEQEELRSD